MSIRVVELHDAGEAMERARDFLTARPVEHNLLLTILEQSIDFSLGGTFWLVVDGSDVIGLALESPPGMGIVVSPMPPSTARLLAREIVAPIPRVQGEASAAAAFAGEWTQRHHVSVSAVDSGLLYELGNIEPVATAPGELRLARSEERSLLADWARAFAGDTDTSSDRAENVIDIAIARELLWVWHDRGPVSMSGASKPVAGATRVQRVYTPPEGRGSGYATACVEHLSRILNGRGLRCLLYTQMSNPTSNAIYRAIGYTAIAEVLAYEFGGGGG
jgi:uncharacterized protein